jgi:hypothetical protein
MTSLGLYFIMFNKVDIEYKLTMPNISVCD